MSKRYDNVCRRRKFGMPSKIAHSTFRKSFHLPGLRRSDFVYPKLKRSEIGVLQTYIPVVSPICLHIAVIAPGPERVCRQCYDKPTFRKETEITIISKSRFSCSELLQPFRRIEVTKAERRKVCRGWESNFLPKSQSSGVIDDWQRRYIKTFRGGNIISRKGEVAIHILL